MKSVFLLLAPCFAELFFFRILVAEKLPMCVQVHDSSLRRFWRLSFEEERHDAMLEKFLHRYAGAAMFNGGHCQPSFFSCIQKLVCFLWLDGKSRKGVI